MSGRKFLMLGPPQGWHAGQLRSAAHRMGHHLEAAPYESIAAEVAGARAALSCQWGAMSDYDAVLTRTMPAASLEKITFRLATLHLLEDQSLGLGIPIVNSPRALELAIDKFATIARLSAAGYPTPPTRFVQSRDEAMAAFDGFDGDCVVKPLFGGEGRGVMRIIDRQLAWYSFSALEQLGAVIQVQPFIHPGGRDTRLLVVGDRVFGIRRENALSFRSNVSAGSSCRPIAVDETLGETVKRIARLFGLRFASVDLIDNDNGPELFLEVNAIPGWKGAQQVVQTCIAECVIETLNQHCGGHHE